MAKHVIFLGAGASFTSGYPLAVDLRIALTSQNAFQRLLSPGIGDEALCRKLTKELFEQRSEAVKLFREGGFATVDEFSFLAREKHKKQVQDLKWFLGLIFASHHPEGSFRKPGNHGNEFVSAFEFSDYFPFIQKLFTEEFDELRSDVAVFTYNYDPYLEFALNRAYDTRRNASHKKSEETRPILLSGFCDRNADAVKNGNGFCLLKLHGTSVVPAFSAPNPQHETAFTFNDVFLNRTNLVEKLKRERHIQIPGRLETCVDLVLTPPILFPWEIFNKDGGLLSEDIFREIEGRVGGVDIRYMQQNAAKPSSYYEVFKAIWQRAQRELIDAEKISFVGLSMHSFLKPGLKYLFEERCKAKRKNDPKARDNGLEIVLACPGAMHPGAEFRKAALPDSPAARLASTLTEVYPLSLKWDHSGALATRGSIKRGTGGVVCYEDFKSFINAEL